MATKKTTSKSKTAKKLATKTSARTVRKAAGELPPVKEATAWAPKRPGLMLRTCGNDMRAHFQPPDGRAAFQWPDKGYVEAPDWQSGKHCGHGLHGLLWGEGDAGMLCAPSAKFWLVVEVDLDEVVDLGGKVKAPRGNVVFCGAQQGAGAYLAERAPGKAVHYGTATAGEGGTATAGTRGTATAGYGGTATAGYGGTATAGYGGTATAGEGGTATAGEGGTATAGEGGTATAGYGGTATAGTRGTATAGEGGTATAGYGGTATAGTRGTATAGTRGTATAGEGGTATAGEGGTATAGYGGTATAGTRGTATAGYGGTATAGYGGTATAGYGGTATAGEGGTISIRYYDPKRDKYRIATAEVGENGIEPDTYYVLDEGHRFVKHPSKVHPKRKAPPVATINGKPVPTFPDLAAGFNSIKFEVKL